MRPEKHLQRKWCLEKSKGRKPLETFSTLQFCLGLTLTMGFPTVYALLCSMKQFITLGCSTPWSSLFPPSSICPCCSLGLECMLFSRPLHSRLPSFHPLSLRVAFSNLATFPAPFSNTLLWFISFIARTHYLTLFYLVLCLLSVSPARI